MRLEDEVKSMKKRIIFLFVVIIILCIVTLFTAIINDLIYRSLVSRYNQYIHALNEKIENLALDVGERASIQSLINNEILNSMSKTTVQLSMSHVPGINRTLVNYFVAIENMTNETSEDFEKWNECSSEKFINTLVFTDLITLNNEIKGLKYNFLNLETEEIVIIYKIAKDKLELWTKDCGKVSYFDDTKEIRVILG